MHRFLLALALIVTVQPTAAQVAPNSGTTSTGNVTILFRGRDFFRSADKWADAEPRELHLARL
jgi:hypothetical protein